MNKHYEQIYKYLIEKYQRIVINKKELASEMNVSVATINLYITKGINVPHYKKLGKSKNAKVVFHISDVADFLSKGYTKTMYKKYFTPYALKVRCPHIDKEN